MENAGLVVLVVALVVATAFGLWRRRTDGRLRTIAPLAPLAPKSASGVRSPAAAPIFPAADLGIALGERASLVQFSSAFCQPCRATRRVLTEVADMVDGVVAVDLDAEAHLDLVRRWNVLRTPTVFVLDASGAVRQRAVGQPRKVDVVAALGAIEESVPHSRPRSET